MIRMMLGAVALSTALIGAAHAQSAAGDEELARTYIDHYSRLDWDAMEALMAEDVVFSDATAQGEGIGADGLHHEGRAETMQALRDFSARYNPIELGFVWDDIFESNGRVVFIGHVNATFPTEDPGEVFRWRARQVSVVTVRDGLVVQHDDFANYATPEQSVIPAQ